MKPTIRLAAVGCGAIGRRRAEALPPGTELVACFDLDESRSEAFAKDFGCKAFPSLNALLDAQICDAVFVATINSALTPTVSACLNASLHVLVEKPGACSLAEFTTIIVPDNLVLKLGFNHRFHPAFQKLQTELKQNVEDPILHMRARYGNGARVGFDQEWRAKVELSGGGELLDQGVHVLDLASVLLPDLEVSSSISDTIYWDMQVDDNTWALLSTPRRQVFSMHVSSTEWKNEFRFEVYTRKRKYVWDGLGRSYGPETLTVYTMKPEMGPPDQEKFEFSGPDTSWLLENSNFAQAIQSNVPLLGGYEDARRVLKLVGEIYRYSEEHSHLRNPSATHPKWKR
jgi:predicted dehydrogenase